MLSKLKSTTFLAVLACLLWSTAFVGIKIGLEYSSPMQFAGTRFFLSGLMILSLVASWKRLWLDIKRHFRVFLKIAFFQTFVLYTLFYQGINLVEGATTAIIIGSQPLFTSLVAHITMKNDLLTLRKFRTIVIGILGIVLVALEKGLNLSGNSLYGQLLGIGMLVLANLASGYGNVLVSKQSELNISPVGLSSVQLIIGGLGLFVVSLFVEPFHGFVFEWPYYASLFWLSFLSAAAFSLWFTLLNRPGVKVSDLNIWKFIIPVFGAIFSWLIIPDEVPTVLQISGMVFIGLSLILYNFQNRKKKF
ncbi:DMT family transporter [Marinilabilia sp.]|uniref:DMT family transporter n=1 Tax=Marinilabilia sp. TaxID=2021252 RepID=UPI0025C1AA93|nr:DMT family transporter [Marinilabilia sp.]